MKRFIELMSELRQMPETIDAQYMEVAGLNLNMGKQQKENRGLHKQSGKNETSNRNSDNCSTPLSEEKMQDEVIFRTKSLYGKSSLKPNVQLGHEG